MVGRGRKKKPRGARPEARGECRRGQAATFNKAVSDKEITRVSRSLTIEYPNLFIL
jgi:hypothetical protein